MTTTKIHELTIINNTDYTEIEIRDQRVVGVIRNGWRQRTVELFEDEEDETKLFMIGTTLDGKTVIISHEAIGMDEKQAMAVFPRTLVRQ